MRTFDSVLALSLLLCDYGFIQAFVPASMARASSRPNSQRVILADESESYDEYSQHWTPNDASNNNTSPVSRSTTLFRNTFMQLKKKSMEKPPMKNNTRSSNEKKKRIAPMTPEVNQWTSIMSQGKKYYQKETVADLSTWYRELRDMSSYDTDQVERYWSKLLPTVNYLGTECVAKVYDALRVAYRAHRGQMRKSGDPFIIHPLEVGILLADLKMDAETVMAGLLHDTVEDTDLTFDQIETMFGQVVRSIVEGETKVSKLPKLAFSDYADEQAENLRQMFVAMTDDYRIIIVKLADRLHNMRTLRHMKPEKQIKISRETLDIFAPLAHRMGIWQFKSELEDIAFKYLYPGEYKHLNRMLVNYQSKYQGTLDKSQRLLQKSLNADRTLQDQAKDVVVYGRTKELYSLWYKMELRGEKNLDNIVDVVALRVIITPSENNLDSYGPSTDRGVWLCYHVLGLVQHLPGFQPVPTRVKDYISFPKPNGYQSLHTALMLNGQAIEVQIRTNEMNQVAEFGMAAHWAYTDKKRRGSDEEVFNTPWLSSIKEWQNDKMTARDFVDSVRNELLGKRVFVFLRNGKILNLARGATVIDAAFQIHSEVLLTMHGVEINGKPVPFSYVLKNGDVVSIMTGEGRPQPDWVQYAQSRSTRSKLRAYFRQKQKESLREAGKMLLMDYLWMHGPLLEKSSYLEDDFVAPTTPQELSAFLPGKTRYTEVDDLLIEIAKKGDRAFLHQTIAKLFYIPQSLLTEAEKNSKVLVPPSVNDAVHESIQDAVHAAIAADDEPTNPSLHGAVNSPYNYYTYGQNATSTTMETVAFPDEARYTGDVVDSGEVEYADVEHLCSHCLPVKGDEIIGTRIPSSQHATTVHRVGCPHAQNAINQVRAARLTPPPPHKNGRFSVDSFTLRNRKGTKSLSTKSPIREEPVKLQWSDLEDVYSHEASSMFFFMAEVVVVAQDRKLLLADCSEIVSERCEICKTGSATTDEHATLLFLVKVSSIAHLQIVMDELNQVQSVMSVERRFGSELL